MLLFSPFQQLKLLFAGEVQSAKDSLHKQAYGNWEREKKNSHFVQMTHNLKHHTSTSKRRLTARFRKINNTVTRLATQWRPDLSAETFIVFCL